MGAASTIVVACASKRPEFAPAPVGDAGGSGMTNESLSDTTTTVGPPTRAATTPDAPHTLDGGAPSGSDRTTDGPTKISTGSNEKPDVGPSVENENGCEDDEDCAAAYCLDGVATSASVCNPAGECTETDSSPCHSGECAPDGRSCEGGCSASGCGEEGYCDPSGSCFEKQSNGDSCSSSEQCESAHCVDGLCCDTACTGLCESCGEAGSVGTCRILTGDPLPARGECDGSGACKGQCDGTTAGVCSYPGQSTECSLPTCSSGQARPAATCDGAGNCSTPTATECASRTCADTTSCLGSCTSTSCGTTDYCAINGDCKPKKAPGQACGSAAECTSANCVDGVCCSSACTGQCQVCNASGACVRNDSGAPIGGRQPCNGAATDCEGTCDGSSDGCSYPDTATTCGPLACSVDLTEVNYTACNGAGACSTNASNECYGSTYCSGTSCANKKSNGNACGLAVECSSSNCSVNPSTSKGLCCPSGQSNCGSCVTTTTDSNNCGTCGNVCGSRETCQSGDCACVGTTLSCGSCGTWTFESNTFEGWLDLQSPSYGGGNSGGLTSLRNAAHPSGSSSGRVLVAEFDGTIGSAASWSVGLCPSGNANVDDLTFSADIYLEIDSGELAFDGRFIFLEVWNSTTGTDERPLLTGISAASAFQWMHVEATISLTTATHVGFSFHGAGEAVGRVYVDNVALE